VTFRAERYTRRGFSTALVTRSYKNRHTQIPQKKRSRNDGGISILFKRAELTTYGLIHHDDDDDDVHENHSMQEWSLDINLGIILYFSILLYSCTKYMYIYSVSGATFIFL
jgi:hypothetical protein